MCSVKGTVCEHLEEKEMKIKLEITMDVTPQSYAAAYGDFYDPKVTPRGIEEDALECAEQALADWVHRVGFAGTIVDPQYVEQSAFEVWNAEQSVNNTDFAEHLHVDCEKHLKQGIDVDQYVDAVLDEMWRGQRYESADGTPHYYEIPKIHTRSGNPVVVRL